MEPASCAALSPFDTRMALSAPPLLPAAWEKVKNPPGAMGNRTMSPSLYVIRTSPAEPQFATTT